MKHLLMHPAYPDIVGEWAAEAAPAASAPGTANDNDGEDGEDPGDPFLTMMARIEIAASRLW